MDGIEFVGLTRQGSGCEGGETVGMEGLGGANDESARDAREPVKRVEEKLRGVMSGGEPQRGAADQGAGDSPKAGDEGAAKIAQGETREQDIGYDEKNGRLGEAPTKSEDVSRQSVGAARRGVRESYVRRSRSEFPFAEPIEQLVGPRRGEFAGATEPEAVRAFFVDMDGGEPASLAEGGGEEQRVFDGD